MNLSLQLLSCLLTGILSMLSHGVEFLVAALLIMFINLLSLKEFRLALGGVLSTLALYGGSQILLVHGSGGMFGSIMASMLFFFFKVAPAIFLGIGIFRHLSITQLLLVLDGLKIPPRASYALTLTCCYLPLFFKEYNHTKESLHLRLGTHRPTPLQWLEFRLAPLMLRAISLSEELANSALIRGLDSPQKTPPAKSPWRRIDTLYALLISLVFIGGIL